MIVRLIYILEQRNERTFSPVALWVAILTLEKAPAPIVRPISYSARSRCFTFVILRPLQNRLKTSSSHSRDCLELGQRVDLSLNASSFPLVLI